MRTITNKSLARSKKLASYKTLLPKGESSQVHFYVMKKLTSLMHFLLLQVARMKDATQK